MGSFGDAGHVLSVDLTSGRIRKGPLDPSLARGPSAGQDSTLPSAGIISGQGAIPALLTIRLSSARAPRSALHCRERPRLRGPRNWPCLRTRMAEPYSAATGLETGPEELKESAERACHLEKLLKVRQGLARTDDAAPRVWFHPKLTPDGGFLFLDSYGKRDLGEKDLERMLDECYEERGWDPLTGIPTRDKLARLGLLEDASC